ncbi:MAG: hypothetical protein HOM52_15960 [Rhodospirillaceae bacterium]|jgi:hypothetical protein|nr:hypothetical protein [Rhodospirillaceae bacterium]
MRYNFIPTTQILALYAIIVLLVVLMFTSLTTSASLASQIPNSQGHDSAAASQSMPPPAITHLANGTTTAIHDHGTVENHPAETGVFDSCCHIDCQPPIADLSKIKIPPNTGETSAEVKVAVKFTGNIPEVLKAPPKHHF